MFFVFIFFWVFYVYSSISILLRIALKNITFTIPSIKKHKYEIESEALDWGNLINYF